MNVGELRALLADKPDDEPVCAVLFTREDAVEFLDGEAEALSHVEGWQDTVGIVPNSHQWAEVARMFEDIEGNSVETWREFQDCIRWVVLGGDL